MVRRGATESILRAQTVVEGRSIPSKRSCQESDGPGPWSTGKQCVGVTAYTKHCEPRFSRPKTSAWCVSGRERGADSSMRPFRWSIPAGPRTAGDVDRILRQRTALLRTTGRRLDPDSARTLDVWDQRLDEAGTALVEAREALVAELGPRSQAHYTRLAGGPSVVTLAYRRSWDGRLLDALVGHRNRDLERGVSLIGPHRDELEIALEGLPSRTHSSQGEQRSVALALRLAAHGLATDRLGSAPVLLLDDVFSELDPRRSTALLASLPPGQTLLTTALPLPMGWWRPRCTRWRPRDP